MINKSLLKCEAEKIGVLLDETALDRFDLYAEMLVETNKTLNLTAITDPDEIVYKHFVDSLALLSCVNFKDNAKVIDVGTGAGFPGVVLLIARPDLKMTLLDGTNKRLVFIANVLDELGLGDKSLSVNLDMIPTLGLNAIYSGLNSLTDSLNSLTDLATIGMNAVDVNVKTTKK